MSGVSANTHSKAPQNWIAPRSKVLPIQRPVKVVSGTPHQQKSASDPVRNDLRFPELQSLFSKNSFEQRFQPDSTILLHGETADAVFLVTSGTVRCCTIDSTGSRQIFRFAKKGEFIGIADVDAWHFTAEAVDHVILKTIPRETVERDLKTNSALQQEFRVQTCELLECREQQLLSITSRKAPERLFHFLCDYAASRRGAENSAIALPMCRRDIADHLGLSVETVSRAFTDLRLKGRIELATCEKYRILPATDQPGLQTAANSPG